ncbi:hypothetical protein Afil01_35340 [Actinorhabdospora filicis]|uniref:Uncharacterized protein n=1 Tax=Actinorhabdospora filicis TaxID=1785913 RepID=A0A9W6W401_9ACTN|nr:hypothetical protein [Actinorhabdospora filicis]GLZ78727.1 hypothetical protein Afil01_35340 [Actinorhabdospora filicis]
MAKQVKVPDGATQHLIRQAYEAGGEYQWAREAWKNSQESNASRIEFGIETQAAAKSGVLRRVILDNGDGMARDVMPEFLTTFGGGGKTIGLGENFGQGFKSSVLPWNPYGVVVISYTEDSPDGAMLWIERDRRGDYVLKEFVDEDGSWDDVVPPYFDEEHGCDWAKIRPDWMTTGTIIVLLGASRDSSTVDGDPDKKETLRGVVRYLNERLLSIPAGPRGPIDTKVTYLETVKSRTRRETQDKTIELPDGTTVALHQRKVSGLEHYIPDQALRGSVVVDRHGTRVDWYYVPEPEAAVGGSADYITQRPVVTVAYKGEAYHTDSGKYRFRRFGVSDELVRRTWLIIHPPVYKESHPTNWGVLPQASRNMLISKGGGALPWDEWGDAFYANFPPELADARDRARQSEGIADTASMAKNLGRILDQYNHRFAASRVLASSRGKVQGTPLDADAVDDTKGPEQGQVRGRGPRSAEQGSSGNGARPIAPGANGTARGVSGTIKSGFPAYQWKAFDEDEAKYLARYDEKDRLPVDDGTEYRGVVWLNIAHPVFATILDYWTKEHAPMEDEAQVMEVVKGVYGEEAVARVLHVQRLNGTTVAQGEDGKPIVMGKHDVASLLTPEVMTGGLLGLVNVEQRISKRLSARFGRRGRSV